jgi:hypothetical protein
MEGDLASDSYSDCPVHHPIEGKFGLPSWPPTAHSCLGAIKGTPRHMEEKHQAYKKHPKTSRLRFHAIGSSFLRFEHHSSCKLLALCLCVHVLTCVCCCAADLSLACVALSNLTLCFLCDLNCKGERLQIVEIPRKREEYSKGKYRGIQVDHWIT